VLASPSRLFKPCYKAPRNKVASATRLVIMVPAPLCQRIHDGLRTEVSVTKHQVLARTTQFNVMHHVAKTSLRILQEVQHIVARGHDNARLSAFACQCGLPGLNRAHGVQAMSTLHTKYALPVFLQDGQLELGQAVASDGLHLVTIAAADHRLRVAAIKAQARTMRMECILGGY
jgi:hypothetical protein